MITLFIGLALISIGVSAALIISKVRENALAAKKTKAVTDYVAPNQDEIDALESDVFGIGKEISGLPGYTWRIKQGVSYVSESTFQVVHDPQGIEISLLDEKSVSVDKQSLASKRNVSAARSRPVLVKRTVEDMKAKTQYFMKEMVAREIGEREFGEGLKDIIKEYNGKPVE